MERSAGTSLYVPGNQSKAGTGAAGGRRPGHPYGDRAAGNRPGFQAAQFQKVIQHSLTYCGQNSIVYRKKRYHTCDKKLKMTRFKELRRIEAAIEQENVGELEWALWYCQSRKKISPNKRAQETWRQRVEHVKAALEKALDRPALKKKAEAGNAEAQYWLGRTLMTSSVTEAISWWERAAQGGSADAAVQLGLFCEQGPHSVQAREWFERAEVIEPGSGAHYLAVLYASGCGGPKDEAKAVDLYKRAVEYGVSAACIALAHAYSNGLLGLPRDQAKANEYDQKFANARKAEREKLDTMFSK
jgi:hypothetical protein